MSNIIDSIERAQLRRVPRFKAGDTVRVHFQVIEGARRRVQVYEGIVIKRQGSGVRETFTVRKQSFGVGVERTFPLHSPKIEKIEVMAIGDVNRAKLYYLRGRVGKKARVREMRYGTARPEAVEDDFVETPVDEELPVEDDQAEVEPEAVEEIVEEPTEVEADRGGGAGRGSRRGRGRAGLSRVVAASAQLRHTHGRPLRRAVSSRAGEADRTATPAIRPEPRRAVRRGGGRGGSRLARGAARRRGRPARLRLAEGAQGAPARVSQRLEAVLRGAARGALPRGARAARRRSRCA